MPLITEPQLSIDYNEKTRVANVRATCRVVFRPPEDCLIKLCPDAPWYALSCDLVPVDFGAPIPNQRLAWLGQKTLPPLPADADPPIAFDLAVAGSVLNEDIVGRDEITGIFYLSFKLTNTQVNFAYTNVVTGLFR